MPRTSELLRIVRSLKWARHKSSSNANAVLEREVALRKFNDIPGPLALPMLKHAALVLPKIGNFHHTVGLGVVDGLRSRYGDLVRLAKGRRKRPILYVFDPEIMRKVYECDTTEPVQWNSSPLERHRQSKCLSYQRNHNVSSVIRSVLQEASLLKVYTQSLKDISEDLTRRLSILQDRNALNDHVETEIHRWALETLGCVIFGSRLGCLDSEPGRQTDNPSEELVNNLKEIADLGYMIRREETLRAHSETFERALKLFDKNISLVQCFLKDSLRVLGKQDCSGLMLLKTLRNFDGDLLPVAADLLLAGVEPLCHTALALLYHLAVNPAQQQRAHDELCWREAASSSDAGFPSDLPYLAACARETLRLYPATGGVIRRTKETTVLYGYEIPPGVDIVLAHGVTSVCEKQWGRASRFIPERWCKEGWMPLRAAHAHPMSSQPVGDTCPAALPFLTDSLASLAAGLISKSKIEWHGAIPNMTVRSVNRLQPPYHFVLQNI